MMRQLDYEHRRDEYIPNPFKNAHLVEAKASVSHGMAAHDGLSGVEN